LISHFKTKDFDAIVELNYFGHLAQRSLKLDFMDHSIEADIKTMKVDFYKNLKLVDSITLPGEYKDMYVNQWKYFFANMNNPSIMNNLSEASNVFSTLLQLNTKL
jgi:hypothetical protein